MTARESQPSEASREPTGSPGSLARARTLARSGRVEDALALLRDALRRGALVPEEVQGAGRLIAQTLGPDAEGAVHVTLAAQITTAWIKMALVAVAWARGIPAVVTEGVYDNVLDSLSSVPGPKGAPRVVVLIPSSERLLDAPEESLAASVETEMALWRRSWDLARGAGARIVQVGYDPARSGALGPHLGSARGGRARALRDANAALRDELPRGSYFVDLELASGNLGRAAFYDPRRWFWTKQPVSERGTVVLAEHLAAGIRAVTTGPKKVLVLDLDSTLWGGVVGELGPFRIALGDGPEGEAYLAFQRHVKALSRRGVVLAVASKNNPEDAREAIGKNPAMLLELDDFAALEIGWDRKSLALERIASTLDLGLDSFVFFDDSPAEREEVRLALPSVEVVEVPDDPSEYVRALEAGLWFEAVELTDADRDRAEQYRVERSRREHRAACSSPEDYFRSLEMRADLRRLDDADLERVVQLLAKTNQFNLTTRRHARDEVLGLRDLPGSIALTLRVQDRFGDHGLVSVLIAVPGPEPGTTRIDTWLMSCRVIGRSVEHFLFRAFLDECRARGHERIIGEFVPSKKNAVVERLYPSLGFVLREVAGGMHRFELETGKATPPPTYVVPGS